MTEITKNVDARATKQRSTQGDLNTALRKLICKSETSPRTTTAAMMVSAVRLTVLLDGQKTAIFDEHTRASPHHMLVAMLTDAFTQREAMRIVEHSTGTIN